MPKKSLGNTGEETLPSEETAYYPSFAPFLIAATFQGIAIFNASLDETKKIMDEDPGVKTGIFVYEVHSCRSFPGDCLP
jgi:hypothetical protein